MINSINNITSDMIFTPGRYEPTASFEDVLNTIEDGSFESYAPEAAAAILAYYVSGVDFDRLVQALVTNGLTVKGLVQLTSACVQKLGDM